MLPRSIPKVFIGTDNDWTAYSAAEKGLLKNIIEALIRLEVELFLTPAVFQSFASLTTETKDKSAIKAAKVFFTEDPRSENPDLAVILDIRYLSLLGAKTVPILEVREAEKFGYEEFNPQTEKGRCFCFTGFDVWTIFAAVVRALENYRFPYDWNNIVRACHKKPAEAKPTD